MLKKKVLLNIERVYTANAFHIADYDYVVGGSETQPVVSLYDFKKKTAKQLPDCPGGVMGFVPANQNLYYSVQGLYPGFNGLEAGIYCHLRKGCRWSSRKVMHLPFAHRCDVVEFDGKQYVIAVSVSKHKAEPADWSKGGEIYALEIMDAEGNVGEPQLIDNKIFRNHGMLKADYEGQSRLFVSGAEGIYYISKHSESWELVRVFDKEVSEFGFVDFDGDGVPELAAIEPFHGDTVKVYKKTLCGWEEKFSAGLSFGHGLSCGVFNGEPVLLAGNRSGSLTLDMFRYKGDWNLSREVIEEEVGPTQTLIVSFGGVDYILSANQKKNEVAIYYV